MACLMLTMSAAAAFSTILINGQVLALLARARAGTIHKERLEQADSVATLLALFSVLIAVGAAITFCAWLHRVLTNLAALGAPEKRYSPGYAVWAFFIPVVNLVVPVRALRDAWGAADVPRFLRIWWFTWIACNLLAWTSAALGFRGDYENGLAIGIAGDAVTIVAAGLAIRVIRRFTRRADDLDAIQGASRPGTHDRGAGHPAVAANAP